MATNYQLEDKKESIYEIEPANMHAESADLILQQFETAPVSLRDSDGDKAPDLVKADTVQTALERDKDEPTEMNQVDLMHAMKI